MRLYLISPMLLCALSLFSSAGSAIGSSAGYSAAARQSVALWLSQQLHRPIEAGQVLVAPGTAQFDGCSITRARFTPIGATSLSLRCPTHLVPQLILLNFPFTQAVPRSAGSPIRAALSAGPFVPPIVRAGASLNADWRTDSMHAQLPVVALGSGAAGAEIRVRIAHTNRIMRARILSAHNVTIVPPGV